MAETQNQVEKKVSLKEDTQNQIEKKVSLKEDTQNQVEKKASLPKEDNETHCCNHYLITQAQVIVFGIIFVGFMQMANHLSFYLVICFPILLILYLFDIFIYCCCGYSACVSNFKNGICFFICCPIFFGVFFGLFHPTASIKFEKVENCFISGQFSKSIDVFESYSILYVNFDYEEQQYLGYACASSNYEDSPGIITNPHLFLYKGDKVCGNVYNSSERGRLLTSTIRKRKLSTGAGTKSYVNIKMNIKIIIKFLNNSQVKLASWFCIERNYDIEEYTQQQSCYVHFYRDSSKAKENGKNRESPRYLGNFPLISFSETAYYPEADIVCLVLFCFYPFLNSTSLIFYYTSNCILRLKKRSQQVGQSQVMNQNEPDVPQILLHTQEFEKKPQNIDNINNEIVQIQVIPMVYNPQNLHADEQKQILQSSQDSSNQENRLKTNSISASLDLSPNIQTQQNIQNSPLMNPILKL